jgi:hypothetical protein
MMLNQISFSELKISQNSADSHENCENTSALVGKKANISWKSIPMEHLRYHPCYQSLGEPHTVKISSPQDLSLYRQDSWQWDALHKGRLTTSKAAACLGFYESKAGKILQIPSSLVSHARTVAAWRHLLEKPPRNWKFLEENGFIPNPKNRQDLWRLVDDSFQSDEQVNKVTKPIPFPYSYHPGDSNHKSVCATSTSSARLAWGSVQVNYCIHFVLLY